MKDKITVGMVTSAVGIKGELRVYPYTDIPERFEQISCLLMEECTYDIEKVGYRKGMIVLKLKGLDDRNTAELQRGKKLYIQKEQMWEIPEDTYFVSELLGCRVYDEQDKALGVLSDVIQNSAQDLYEIESESGKKFLVPAVKEFIRSVDIHEKRVVVHLIEGLDEL